MKLEVFDKDSRQRVGMIKIYTYASYEEEFYGPGSFSIKMPAADESMPHLTYGNYILFDAGVLGVIKGLKDVEGEEDEIEVYGYLSNHILSYRSILLAKRFTGKIPAVFRQMATELFISPDDAKRKIPYFRLTETFPDVGKSQVVQNSGKDFLTVCNEVGMPYDIGVKLYPVVEDLSDGEGTNLTWFEFQVIYAADRTLGNEAGNDPVVFSFDLNNLERIEYEEDGRAFRSVAVVASEGEGAERKTVEVGDTDRFGIDREELYVDARDIQSDSGSEGGGTGGGGTGGGSSDAIWRPTVSSSGVISWEKSTSSEAPQPQNIKGQKGDDGVPGISAGFGAPTASVDANVGVPSVTVSATGSDTEKVFSFEFRNLKGAKGDNGSDGQKGDPGQDGFSPQISVEEDTEESYKLNILTKDNEIVTPNLKATGGSGGGMTDEQYDALVVKLDAIKAVVDEHTTKLDEISQSVAGGPPGTIVSKDWVIVQQSSGVSQDGATYTISYPTSASTGDRNFFLAIDVDEERDVLVKTDYSGSSSYYLTMRFNDEVVVNNLYGGTSSNRPQMFTTRTFHLKKGVNSIYVSVTKSASGSAYFYLEVASVV